MQHFQKDLKFSHQMNLAVPQCLSETLVEISAVLESMIPTQTTHFCFVRKITSISVI